MTQRIMAFAVDDLIISPEQITKRLTKSCNTESMLYRVSGCCQVDKVVYFVLLPLRKFEPQESYIIAPISDSTDAGITALFAERWQAGFNTLGTICLGQGSYLGLFVETQD